MFRCITNSKPKLIQVRLIGEVFYSIVLYAVVAEALSSIPGVGAVSCPPGNLKAVAKRNGNQGIQRVSKIL